MMRKVSKLYDKNHFIRKMRKDVTAVKKAEIFVLTYLAFTSVQALRTTYAFTKSYLPAQIGLEETYIGLVDSIMMMCVGIGNFLIAIRVGPGKVDNPVLAIWVALMMCALEYCLVAFSVNTFTGRFEFALLILLMTLSGFLQSYVWPNLLPLVRTVTDPDKDATLLGFWATGLNLGNLIGFAISQIFVLESGLHWSASMYIAAVYMFIIAAIISFRIQGFNLEDTNNQETASVTLIQSSDHLSIKEHKHLSLGLVLHSPRVVLLTICFTLLKSVMLGILFWLPIYFHSIGLAEYQLYIPMVYESSAVIGSVILGAIFQIVVPYKRNMVLAPVLFLLIVCFMVLWIFDLSVVMYFVMIGLVGVFQGGSCNTMASLVTIELARAVPPAYHTSSLQFFSAMLMGMGNTFAALTQIVISFSVNENNQEKLFGIFMVFTIFNFFSMTAAVIIEIKDKQKNMPNPSMPSVSCIQIMPIYSKSLHQIKENVQSPSFSSISSNNSI